MGVSKHRKGQKKKAAARRNEMVAKRKMVGGLVEELKQELAKIDDTVEKAQWNSVPQASLLTLTPTPNEFDL